MKWQNVTDLGSPARKDRGSVGGGVVKQGRLVILGFPLLYKLGLESSVPIC